MSPYSAIGVDIGKDSLTFAFATDSRNRSRWPVQTVTYDNPDWWRHVVDLIAPGAVVVAEPTGWHYLTPLLTVIEQMTTTHLWLASHDASRAARQSAISASKTDEMDARALAYIADLLPRRRPVGRHFQRHIARQLHADDAPRRPPVAHPTQPDIAHPGKHVQRQVHRRDRITDRRRDLPR